jgi:DNA-binding winged helix-turn-helix (wHTH) protein
VPRYRFQEFELSPRRRTLLRDGRELPLIPRYFDLLVFLIERRNTAVHRQEIFDHVWRDVVVSDSALSQAIRTIRRVLDDDSREPRFVRTVSRHGYRFVFEGVVEEEEDDVLVAPHAPVAPGFSRPEVDADVATGPEKIVLPGLERPLWVNAAIGGGAAGLFAGGLGGLLLAIVPDSRASMSVLPVLALLGGGCGAAGAAGVAAGIALAGRVRVATSGGTKSVGPGFSRAITIAGAAIGGGLVGLAAQLLGHATLQTIAGLDVSVGGLVQGLGIGAASGIARVIVSGGASSTRPADADLTTSAPRTSRHRVALIFAAVCGVAALALVLAGLPLVGGTLHAISQASAGAQTTLAPLGELLGEQDFGPLTAAIIGTGEGLLFGAGFGLGLSRSR